MKILSAISRKKNEEQRLRNGNVVLFVDGLLL